MFSHNIMIESLCKAISSMLKHFEMNTTKISSKNMEESNVAIYLHNNNITYTVCHSTRGMNMKLATTTVII